MVEQLSWLRSILFTIHYRVISIKLRLPSGLRFYHTDRMCDAALTRHSPHGDIATTIRRLQQYALPMNSSGQLGLISVMIRFVISKLLKRHTKPGKPSVSL